jgi:biotin transporter BioY
MDVSPLARSAGRPATTASLRIWHLALLVVFVDIQNHRGTEPTLIALAAGGYAGFALAAWVAWTFARRFEGRMGRVWLLAAYLVAMGAFYLMAILIYLSIERIYLGIPLFG